MELTTLLITGIYVLCIWFNVNMLFHKYVKSHWNDRLRKNQTQLEFDSIYHLIFSIVMNIIVAPVGTVVLMIKYITMGRI